MYIFIVYVAVFILDILVSCTLLFLLSDLMNSSDYRIILFHV